MWRCFWGKGSSDRCICFAKNLVGTCGYWKKPMPFPTINVPSAPPTLQTLCSFLSQPCCCFFLLLPLQGWKQVPLIKNCMYHKNAASGSTSPSVTWDKGKVLWAGTIPWRTLAYCFSIYLHTVGCRISLSQSCKCTHCQIIWRMDNNFWTVFSRESAYVLQGLLTSCRGIAWKSASPCCRWT